MSLAEFLKGAIRRIKPADYEILHTIGKGPYSRIQFAVNKASKKYVVFKTYKKAELIDENLLNQVRLEAKCLNTIENNFLPKFDGLGQDEKYLYLSIEFITGGDLLRYLNEQITLPYEQATLYLAEVICMIEAVHLKNIIHRDIKPENLLIDNKFGYLKLIDFGCAKFLEGKCITMVGTPGYMAPEMIEGKGYGKPVDWWAAGALYYEMLVGVIPFYDNDPLKVYEKTLKEKVMFPSNLDNRAKELIKALLEKDPTKRLGCTKGGLNDAKNHPTLKEIDFNAVKNNKGKSLYIPEVSNNGDYKFYPKFDDAMIPPREIPKEEDPFEKW